jgi:hypothetical protein
LVNLFCALILNNLVNQKPTCKVSFKLQISWYQGVLLYQGVWHNHESLTNQQDKIDKHATYCAIVTNDFHRGGIIFQPFTHFLAIFSQHKAIANEISKCRFTKQGSREHHQSIEPAKIQLKRHS